MIDGLYLKSLLLTLAVYLVLVGGLVVFVVVTGLGGVFTIFAVIVLLVCYFYGCFGRIDFTKKGLRS